MKQEKWYETQASDQDVVISSRVRLARNLRKYPFPTRLSDENATEMIHDVVSSIKNDRNAIGYYFDGIDMKGLSPMEQHSLLEKHIISPEFMNKTGEKALLLKDDESIGIMMNEEDHIRIQTIFPGETIDDGYDLADKVDNLIEEMLEYAYDKEFGYLTACPTNTGTGLRASMMLHIPVLEMSGQLMNIVQSITKFGLTVRGIYGEGSEPMGSIYQISNQVTLGKSEHEILSVLKSMTGQIIAQEKALQKRLLTDRSQELEDKIYRSFGTLAYAKKLTAKEAMSRLSDIRLGFNTGILHMPKPKETIYQMMMNVQPGNIQRLANKNLSELERDIFRARYIQDCLTGHHQ